MMSKQAWPSSYYNSTDPTNADSDGDLLMGGFEVANGLDPVVADNATADIDSDRLDTLNEQIHTTDPLNPDSDGDRTVVDGQEVVNGADPRNPVDNGEKPQDAHDASVMLTIGDHSGSHSERYVLHVGVKSHQSPGYGLVGSGSYFYTTGTYTTTIQHVGTNIPSGEPDYDYTATLAQVSGEASIIFDDPQGILGVHDESTYFYAAGKSATMTATYNCSGQTSEMCECTQLKRCSDCRANDKCMWDTLKQICITYSLWPPLFTVAGEDSCPCEECQAWYDEDRKDNVWLDEVNRLLPCPCSATAREDAKGLVPIGAPTEDWDIDGACSLNGGPYCSIFHQGASGCLRSATSSSTGAGQQCCYGDDGKILPPENHGAGTPDKVAVDVWDHFWEDVLPYLHCCLGCEDCNFCSLYMELRHGDDSHCQNSHHSSSVRK